MALICAVDEAHVRERVQAASRFLIDDDEISVRRATKADRDLLEHFGDGSSQVQRSLLADWKYGLSS